MAYKDNCDFIKNRITLGKNSRPTDNLSIVSNSLVVSPGNDVQFTSVDQDANFLWNSSTGSLSLGGSIEVSTIRNFDLISSLDITSTADIMLSTQLGDIVMTSGDAIVTVSDAFFEISSSSTTELVVDNIAGSIKLTSDNIQLRDASSFSTLALTPSGLTFDKPKVDYQSWFAPQAFSTFGGTWVLTRIISSGVPSVILRKTNTLAETTYVHTTLTLPGRTTVEKGYRLTRVRLVYEVTTQALVGINAKIAHHHPGSSALVAIDDSDLVAGIGIGFHYREVVISSPSFTNSGFLALDIEFATDTNSGIDLSGVLAEFDYNML